MTQVVENLRYVILIMIYYLFYIVNIVGADVMVMQRAQASTTMILTMLNRNNSVPSH